MAASTDPDELQALLSEQSDELFMAKTLDSDLHFAFELQMQEAIVASLASQRSASTLAPFTSPAWLPEGEIDDSVLGVATELMLDDVQSFTLRLVDQEKCQAEMEKTLEDLDRRIFDQQFAWEIFNMPEDERKTYGDNFHRPYYSDGASSSSSSSLSLRSPSLQTENFKLYFKGLVSEERVRDIRVVVASAGIAICDSRDYLIFEVKKPLEAVESGGLVLSSECAELQALIEGLDMAFSLALQRLSIFFDDSALQLCHRQRVRKQWKIGRASESGVSSPKNVCILCAISCWKE
ncbi:hypothetical protein L6164_023998 [Bauhinia variegata]|uniref:Uncharacterized protein n=1 Tax=Bauhinia variegata TaxID=167791 RepID=A0ACB9LXK5_BAUVA|nr:hypothetical protein L6164_023998 [Bauhinia variegata]